MSVYNGSLYFDGNTSYLQLVDTAINIPSGNDNYTVEAWIKPTGGLGIVGWGSWGSGNGVNAFRLGGHYTLINYWWGNDLAVTSPDLFDDNWHHVVATFDGTERRIYMDGSLLSSDNPGSSHSVGLTDNLRVGSTNNGEYFAGNISNLRIVKDVVYTGSTYTIPTTALTAIPNTSLLLNTRFDSSFLTDTSGNGNDMSIVGNVTSSDDSPFADIIIKPKTITFQRSSKLISIPPTAYKYYKWHITAIKDVGIQAYSQLSEFTFLLDGVDTDMSLVTISLLNGHTSPNAEQAINLKDGSLASKFLDYNFEDGGTEVLFEFPTAIIFNGYKWGTGNDSDWRDPKSWTLYGSNDNTNWDVLDTVNDFIATVDRSTFNTPFSYTPTNSIESKLTFTANPPPPPPPFIATIDTTTQGNNFEVNLPYYSTGSYSGTIDWGDGTTTNNSYATKGHTYTTAGTYTIQINGIINGYNHSVNDTLSAVLTSIDDFGVNFSFGDDTGGYFSDCPSLTTVASNIPLSGITNMSYMFLNDSVFNGDINSWNVSSVTDMSYMFSNAPEFNQSLNSWNVLNVTNMSGMFNNAVAFNGNISNWQVNNVTDMSYMFYFAFAFNQDISNWQVGNVTNMYYMFRAANAFNQNLTYWSTGNVTNMAGMFYGAWTFNQPLSGTIGNWNVGKVTNMSDMFNGATLFNQSLNDWDVSSVTDMSYMFRDTTEFNGDISSWNTANVTIMQRMFTDAIAFNGDIGGWDVSKVTINESMFKRATSFNQDISGWNVSNITDMSEMFYGASSFNQPLNSWTLSASPTNINGLFHYATAFNQPLNSWDVSRITDMGNLFSGATSFNQPLNSWDVSSVTNMYQMFRDAYSFDESLNSWNVSNVTNMYQMFRAATAFNQPLNSWNVSSVTDMYQMFNGATAFNQPLNSWNVSGITNMYAMFANTTSFNGNISSWNVSGVTDIGFMFFNATAFNQPLNSWNVSSVTDMSSMFSGATSFNQPLNSWNVSSVYSMAEMFSGASSFNQNISSWNVSNVTNMDTMLHNTALSVSNLDLIYSNWSLLTLQNNVPFDAQPTEYHSYVSSSRAVLTGTYNWNITDGGEHTSLDSEKFIATIDTTIIGGVVTIILPYDSEYSYTGTIDWGDGTITANSFATKSHTYTIPDVYQIKIDGVIGYWNSGFKGSIYTLVSIDNFGNQFSFGNLSNGQYFAGSSRLVSIASDIPLTGITNMYGMFLSCTNFNSDISVWDVSNVTDMSFMFTQATSFNQPLNSWNVSNVTNMSYMFQETSAFNQPLNSWDVSKVTNMEAMFSLTTFNQNIGGWNVGNVTNMTNMFSNNTSFNQNISSWNVGKVTTMSSMFTGASAFNQNISGWNVGNVVYMSNMFSFASSFNQNIGGWNVSKVTDFSSMFNNASSFNQDLSSWNVSVATDMPYMFNGSSLSVSNLDLIYINWSLLTLQNNVYFGAENIEYHSYVSGSRAVLTGTYGWNITDGGVYTPIGMDGLTSGSAGESAYQIKMDYPTSTDGLYWIQNPNINSGSAFQIYADMTTDGGGWTLIMSNGTNSGWTYQNAILLNEATASIDGANYSIISYADYLKKSGTTFQYMIEANARNSFGAIWSAPQSYSFVNTNNTQTNVTIDTKFGTWTYYENGGISQRMPWYANSEGFITTSTAGGGYWWGTLITPSAGWNTAPWLDSGCGTEGCMGAPSRIWYWVR